MTEELICKGTPAEIAEAITAQQARLGFFVEQRGEGALIYIVSHSSDEGPYLLHIHLPFALIGPAPDGQSLLTSRAEGDPQPTQWWESLISELGRLGWLASTSEPAQAERVEDALKRWENSPVEGWNRKAVELWRAGYTAREIARMIDRNLMPKTILNVISSLRGIYGTDVVPERRAKSRPGRKLG